MKYNIKDFLFPKITKQYLFRILLVAIFTFLFFSFICLPFRIKGYSMEPTYMNGQLNLCFKLRYIFVKPERYNVVCIRLAGEKVILLKRVVALEGDVVEIKNGTLLVNEKKIDETYLRYSSDWNLSPRKVDKNNVYVIGDNRSVSIDVHKFGQTSINRIVGVPLW